MPYLSIPRTRMVLMAKAALPSSAVCRYQSRRFNHHRFNQHRFDHHDGTIPLLKQRVKSPVDKRLKSGWLLALMVVVLWFFTTQVFARVDSTPDWEGISSGELWLMDDQRNAQPAHMTQASDIALSVNGLLATVTVKQTFTNPSKHWMEGEYLFPLPEKSAVDRFEVRVGERKIVGQIKEKSQAKKIYQQAKAAGKKVGMLSQQRPNMFTTKVANIAPGESVVVLISYIEQVRFDSGTFRLRLPTTLTPRYMPKTPSAFSKVQNSSASLRETTALGGSAGLSQTFGHHPETPEQPIVLSGLGWEKKRFVSGSSVGAAGHDYEMNSGFNPSQIHSIDAGGHFTLSAEIDLQMTLAKVESLYHEIKVSKSGSRYQLNLAKTHEPMDRDFVLEWQGAQTDTPKAGMFIESFAGDDYGLLMLLPSPLASEMTAHGEAQRHGVSLGKERIYIIDTSGSMSGPSIRQAKQALLQSLGRLTEQDRFNIIAFNSTTDALFANPVVATASMVAEAKRFVVGLKAEGGTEMLPALKRALLDSRYRQFSREETHNSARVRQVIFMTDGAVSNEAQLMSEVQQSLGNQRLFTVGIGAAPNSYFMRKIAEFGRGSFTYIGNTTEVQDKMSALFRQLDQPQLTDIRIRWPNGTSVEHYPSRIPDLYAGQPLSLVIKSANLAGIAIIEGQIGGESWRQEVNILPEQSANLPAMGVAKRWAREKIGNVLDDGVKSQDPEMVRQTVLPLSLKYQVMSPFTRFIAVEERVSRPMGNALVDQRIASMLPVGSTQKGINFPQTAAGSGLFLMLGCIVLAFFFLFMWLYRQPKNLVGWRV